nr:PREDICTED: non-syndromic hearing impairment protein 5 [Latimeria chalumnae]|eukprot:XP_014351702.1 PREDICTED: non-syndromic hearing impairment protein 5 [Latimeria chalumnae]
MFAKATCDFLEEIDYKGDLIAVSSLDDSNKIQLLSLVTKRPSFWFWKKPKYHSSPFTLSDVLVGSRPIKPVVVESDFLKYESKSGNTEKGTIGASVGIGNLVVGGNESVELQSSFGTVRKQEVDVHQLLKDAQERTIDLNDRFVQQTRERKEVLCMIREKLVTTQKCSLLEHIQEEESCGGALAFKSKRIQVSLNENGKLQKDTNVVLEIPPQTAIAYGVIELLIKCSGQYEFCLVPEKKGGFEKEKPPRAFDTLSCVSSQCYGDSVDFGRHCVDVKTIPSEVSLSALKQGMPPLIALLACMLDQLVLAEKPDLSGLHQLKPSERKNVTNFLQLLGYTCPENEESLQGEVHERRELLTATHFLLSALEELSDESLVLLGTCCDLQVLPVLQHLFTSTLDDGSASLKDPALSCLTDKGKFHIVQKLFTSSNINLEMAESSVKAIISKQPGFFPLILGIVVTGLAALC